MSAYDDLSNDRQRRFVDNLLTGNNGKPMPAETAYIAAGYSENGARASASALLSNPNVKAALAERRKAAQKRLELSQDEFIDLLAGWATADRNELVDWGYDPDLPADQPQVRLVPTSQLTDRAKSLVEEVSEGPTGVKIKTVSRVAAAQLLSKVLGWQIDRTQDNAEVMQALIEVCKETNRIDQLRRVTEDGESPAKVLAEMAKGAK